MKEVGLDQFISFKMINIKVEPNIIIKQVERLMFNLLQKKNDKKMFRKL